MNTGRQSWWRRLAGVLGHEWRHLTAVQVSDRQWQLPFAAALATGLPLFVGAHFDRLDAGMVGSLGGLVFLYTPPTPMYHRMVTLMACAFAVTACFALGLVTHAFAVAAIPVITFLAIVVTMIVRYYRLGPPGSLFFIMAASIGAYSPVPAERLPYMVGVLFLGTLLAALVAFCYSLAALRSRPPEPVPALPPPSFDYVVFDAVVIGMFVGLALAAAAALQLERPYWVPVSCLAVIHGQSLRAVWNRQLQRVAGTALGLLLAWWLLLLPLDKWAIATAMTVLVFIIETMVVRQYAFAAIFITPLTNLLAEAATLGHAPHAQIIEARFVDTVLGCAVGLAGGVCLHSPRFREAVGRPLRRLVPSRLAPRPPA